MLAIQEMVLLQLKLMNALFEISKMAQKMAIVCVL